MNRSHFPTQNNRPCQDGLGDSLLNSKSEVLRAELFVGGGGHNQKKKTLGKKENKGNTTYRTS